MNKESFSGILYDGVKWGNYCNRTDLYLKPINVSKIKFENDKNNSPKTITKLIINGKKVD